MNGHNTLEGTLSEILAVINPNNNDWSVRFNVINELRSTIVSIESLRGVTVEPFGSFVSNLFTRWGDLDVSIELQNGEFIVSPGRKHKLTLLGDVQRVLRKKGGFGRVQFISRARVPILKLEASYISCDISVNNLLGQMKSKLLFWINEIDGRFRNLVLLVKEWAKRHNINDSKSGTLNSYCLCLLVVFHLQTLVPAILPPLREIYPGNMIDGLTGVRTTAEKHIEDTCNVNIMRIKSARPRFINQSSLSELFISFLLKFSEICSRASTQGVSPHTGQWEDIQSNMRWLTKTYTLFVEDPFEQPANSARTVNESQLVKISGAIEATLRVLYSPHQNQAPFVSVLVGPHIYPLLVRTPIPNPLITRPVLRLHHDGNQNGQPLDHTEMNKRGGGGLSQLSKTPPSPPPLGATPLSDSSSSRETGKPKSGKQKIEKAEIDAVTKQMNSMSTPEHFQGTSVGNVPQHVTPRSVQNVHKAIGQKPKQFESPSSKDLVRDDKFSSPSTFFESDTKYIGNIRSGHRVEERNSSSHFISTPVNTPFTKEEISLTVSRGLQNTQSSQSGKTAPGGSKGEYEKSDDQCKGSFDICAKSSGNVPKLKTSLFSKNREKRNEIKCQVRGENITILRPGMVLLKGYLSLMDQIKLVNLCRDLGLGSGGFYQPGYRDGAELMLKMMCLGKNWDPETNLYGDERPVDGSKPPSIPPEFMQMVAGAIQECHGYLESHSKVKNPKDVLPSMSPNICIVNFYSKTGRLGLHQDKDESVESLRRGLPVVSFSVGDSAEFLFGDERDIFKADKVVLESGDVLIFGGKSRHIFHGVNSISPNTAPKTLEEETKLKPGRLNLTFREF